jgi:hypothetical protein
MMRKYLLAAMLAGVTATAAVATVDSAALAQDAKPATFTGEKYVKDAKISLAEARATALKASPRTRARPRPAGGELRSPPGWSAHRRSSGDDRSGAP